MGEMAESFMRHLTAYAQLQDVTLDGEQAFEELYARLARWIIEIVDACEDGQSEAQDQKIERCIALLGYMNQAIDLSQNFAVGCAVLSLHRFVIRSLLKAKAESCGNPLDGVSSVFLTLAEIFSTIWRGKTCSASSTELRR
jgi:flagellin-specific chaperone FliS